MTINKPMDDKDQPLESAIEGYRCIKPGERKSTWRCSIYVSLRWKFRLNVEGESRTIKEVKFLE